MTLFPQVTAETLAPESEPAGTPRYPKPMIFAEVPSEGHLVIEASAGTGKTFTIEHLVIELLLEHEIRIEEILVVTFTERATGELKARIRALLQTLLEHTDEVVEGEAPAWALDEAARERLEVALRSFDRAAIHTIHGFCQRILQEYAFASGRPLHQELVDPRAAFAAAFRHALRYELARDPELTPYLMAWLEIEPLDGLEGLLFRCRRQRGRLSPQLDEAALAPLVSRLVEALSVPGVRGALELAYSQAAIYATDRKKALGGLDPLFHTAHRALELGLPGLLAGLESVPLSKLYAPKVKKKAGKGEVLWEDAVGPEARALLEVLAELDAASVPLQAAVVQRFLPVVEAALETIKAREGWLDFDDMLELVEAALRDPVSGTSLQSMLRERFRFALIDEFQDTDPVQWAIFRNLFISTTEPPLLEPEARRLFVIGDPKQAIYAFRGADVYTYLDARRELLDTEGALLQLRDNFRSTPALIDALNLIFDQTASPPFFDGEIHYDAPVRSARVMEQYRLPEGSPPVILMTPQAEPEAPLGVDDLKARIGSFVAHEIQTLLHTSELEPSDVFILTRSNAELEDIAEHLRERQLPFAFYKQDGLFQSQDALDVRDLLAAIATPGDPSTRLKAWTTPFFGVAYRDLSATRDLPDSHPLHARLFEWHVLALARRYEELFATIVAASGIVRRALFLRQNDRSLTNVLHIFEILLEETSRLRITIHELVMLIDAFILGRRKPTGSESNLQRLETERSAVQLMTIHKAKGLEAEVVFLFGGFSASSWAQAPPFVYHDSKHRRVLQTAKGDRTADRAFKSEQAQEEQRLLYVALTRARERLYLPFVPDDKALKRKLNGSYRHINDRLRALCSTTTSHLLHRIDLRHVLGAKAPQASPDAPPQATPRRWRPPAPLLEEPERPPALEDLRSRRLRITSYTRLKALEDAPHPLLTLSHHDLPDAPEPPPLLDDTHPLPSGAAFGAFIHELLEHSDLNALKATPDFEAWSTLPSTHLLIERGLLAHGIEARHRMAALDLVYRAMTEPLSRAPLSPIPGLVASDRLLHEVEFLYPLPEESHPPITEAYLWENTQLEIERGFIQGFMDVLFEYEGRVYCADFKTDTLPRYDPPALAFHVDAHYRWQSRLYALAVVRMLHAHDPETFEARFGGMLYLFVRGMSGGHGVCFHRPSFEDVARYEEELRDLPALQPGVRRG